MRDQRLQVAANGAELGRSDVEHLARDVRSGCAVNRIDEILHGKQLVAVASAAEDVDAAPVADPVEQDLEHA